MFGATTASGAPCIGAVLALVALACSSEDAGAPQEADRCGECGAGTLVGEECRYPSDDLAAVLADGLPPADTGERPVFHVSDYEGATAQARIRQATLAAAPVGGAVVLDEVYTVTDAVLVEDGVLYTGGGIRRGCTPHAVTTSAVAAGEPCLPVDTTEGFGAGVLLATTDGSMAGTLGTFAATVEGGRLCRSDDAFAVPAGAHVIRVFNLVESPVTSAGGIEFDSVLFDGAGACNPWTHDWRFNSTWSMRGGPDIVRRSWFHDTPAENLFACDDLVADSVALDLGGSLVHKSCTTPAVSFVRGNYVERANRFTDAVLGHSEGVVVFSANASLLFMTGNTFRTGTENAIGRANADDENFASTLDCFAHFPRLLTLAGAAPARFAFADDTFIDTPSLPEPE